MRIRSRLLLLVSAVLVPALVGAGIGLGYIYKEEQAFNHASMQETARALALALDRDMARREATLHALSNSPSLNPRELGRFHRYASTVARDSDSAIILSDLEGRQILNTRLPFGTRLPPMLPMARQLRTQFGNEVTLVSDLYLPPAGLGPHSFAVQVPVRRGGKVVQFLTMASFAGQMQDLLAEQQLPQGWHATIADRRGVVRETVCVALQAAGFHIETAATADEARRRMDDGEHYDAVLTDVVMPGELSGLDLAEHIRKRHPRTGVVVATGYTDRAVHLPGVRALPKPYELEQAVDALNAAIAG